MRIGREGAKGLYTWHRHNFFERNYTESVLGYGGRSGLPPRHRSEFVLPLGSASGSHP